MRKLTIEEMHKIAKERGGKCLSNIYVNARSKLLWECSKEHRWKAPPDTVKNQGAWCKVCADKENAERRKHGITIMHQIAEERGGKCLSDRYVNSKTKLLWKCSNENHEPFEAVPHNVKNQGTWCPRCGDEKVAETQRLKDGINIMRQIATERGGKCLSDRYVDNSTKLLWECAEGHKFEAPYSSVQSGSWCGICSSGLGERICREFFEQLFGAKFPKTRPKWLINEKGNRMELDGYCEELGIAFEHHGEQHYSTKTQFIKSTTALKKRLKDDLHKKFLCTQNDVKLIIIPSVPHRLPRNKVNEFIRKECRKNNIKLPKKFRSKKVDINKAYKTARATEALKDLRQIAKERGGKLLSSSYVNARTKLLWECVEGHRWEATPDSIKSKGTWCEKCGILKSAHARKLKNGIELMRKVAKERGGKCLSKTYVNNITNLLWECSEGHQWEAAWCNIQGGRWCPECYKIRRRVG